MNLKTDRLVIRDFIITDVQDLYEILGDEKTMYYSEKPFDFSKTETFLLDFCITKKSALAAYHKNDQKVIGYILFKPLKDKVYEIGWFLNKNYWGQGYAFEACSHVIEYGFRALNVNEIIAETIDTIKSIHLMKKLGMEFKDKKIDATTDKQGNKVDIYVYSIKDTNK